MSAIEFPPPRRARLPARVSAAGASEPGITLSVHEAGQGPAVVLCHGFPELGYSWRHQVPALAAAGFRAIAPDQRGYGAQRPARPIAAYDIEQLTGDLVGLLDALGVERAVFVGHDWGGFVAWAMPVLHPERVAGRDRGEHAVHARSPMRDADPAPMFAATTSSCTSSGSSSRASPRRCSTATRALVFEKLHAARRAAARDRQAAARPTGHEPVPPARRAGAAASRPLLRDGDGVLRQRVRRPGFRGGINWYRNLDRNWEASPDVGHEADRRCPA